LNVRGIRFRVRAEEFLALPSGFMLLSDSFGNIPLSNKTQQASSNGQRTSAFAA
jgi:hypothetical protein